MLDSTRFSRTWTMFRLSGSYSLPDAGKFLARKRGVKKSKRGSVLMIKLQTPLASFPQAIDQLLLRDALELERPQILRLDAA